MGIIGELIISGNTSRTRKKWSQFAVGIRRLGNSCKDCHFYITIIIAAIDNIILFSHQYNMFNGIDFSKAEAWEKLKSVISDYVDTLIMSKIK